MVSIFLFLISVLQPAFSDAHLVSQNVAGTQKLHLVGVWQVDDSVIAAGLGDAYRFYPDSTFSFEVSSFNMVSRLKSVFGSYRVRDTTLVLRVKGIVEYKGGTFGYGDDDYWQFFGVKTKRENVKLPDMFFTIKVLAKNGREATRIRINTHQYYRISDNPNAFKE